MKKNLLFIFSLLYLSPLLSPVYAKKVLMVVTNHEKLGTTGKKTGYFFSELTHPYFKFKEANIEVDFASPLGGIAPMDPKSLKLDDPYNKRFYKNKNLMNKLQNTLSLKEVNPKDYEAIIFTGGHGTMWDFPASKDLKKVTEHIYNEGGVVAAVCHGPAALVNLKRKDGAFLISGVNVTAFSNTEEDLVELTDQMPFLLESELKRKGALFSKAEPWKEKVVVDKRIVTGQNPASASKLGEEVIKLIQKK